MAADNRHNDKCSNRYWCTVCGKVHTLIEPSEEYVMKSGWVFALPDGTISAKGEKMRIGFCNGVHKKDTVKG